MTSRTIIAAVGVTFFAVPASAKLAVKGDSQVDYFATGPGGLSIDGKTKELVIGDDGKKVVFTVPLKNLDSGIPLRDEHAKNKYLLVDKYPNATLEVARDDIKLPAEGKRAEGDVKGSFTLKGVTKEVKVHYKAHRDKDKSVGGEGKFKINIHDYGIDVPAYLGVTVDPEMDIKVKFNATDE